MAKNYSNANNSDKNAQSKNGAFSSYSESQNSSKNCDKNTTKNASRNASKNAKKRTLRLMILNKVFVFVKLYITLIPFSLVERLFRSVNDLIL